MRAQGGGKGERGPAPHAAFNPHGVIGGPPHQGPNTPEDLKRFNEQFPPPEGQPKLCFSFWRRGYCNNQACSFKHL